MKRRPTLIIIALVLVILGGSYYFGQDTTTESSSQQTTPQITPQPQSAVNEPPKFNRAQYSIEDSASIWIVVNKQRPLKPSSYVPENLVVPSVALRAGISGSENHVRSDVANALKTMFDAALTEGVGLNAQSAYRSYGFQTSLYNRYVQLQGQAVADTQSARPGHSEHQTGLAVDVGGDSQPNCNIEACFADTPEGKWVAAHAYEYGFIVRYPKDMDSKTGYTYEPWHLRYVGLALATKMHAENVATLEDFFELPAAPDYN